MYKKRNFCISRMSVEEITLSQLKASGRKWMSQREWNSASLISLGGSLAAEVNAVSSLSGPQKQTLVVLAVKELVKESVKGSIAELAKAQQLLQIADDVLPACLNLAVSAARGQLDLKKIDLKRVQTSCFAFLPSLLSFCLPKAQVNQISDVVGISPEASKTLTVENVVAALKDVAISSEEKSAEPPKEQEKKEETKEEEKKQEDEKKQDPEETPLQFSNPSLIIRLAEKTE